MKFLSWLLAVCLLMGCSSMLPSSKRDVVTRWNNFEEAKQSFDEIVPYFTDMEKVRELGFDPFDTPNVQILNQSQVIRAVLPSPLQEPTTIPQGIVDCMRVQEECVGYLIELSRTHRQRDGNFLLDFMNFRRHTQITGWKFGALIVVIDNVVVYKQWSGHPRIEEAETDRNPLGPLQGVGPSILDKAF